MADMPLEEIRRLLDEAMAAVAAAGSRQELEAVRVRYRGGKGALTLVLGSIGKLPAEVRPRAGEEANKARKAVDEAIVRRLLELSAEEALGRGADELDVTLPGRAAPIGHRHPLMTTLERLLEIFVGMGYEVATGPEVEWFDLNFTALNYPPDHPAIDEQDTFYVNPESGRSPSAPLGVNKLLPNGQVILRTQTSPGQIRAMRARHGEGCPVRTLDRQVPPLEVLSHCTCTPAPTRAVVPGRCYRRETVTLTHGDTFHQLECLLVDEGITFADLKGTLVAFLSAYLETKVRLRFRPDFFPFTEPSADFSVNCVLCDARGCRFCKDSGWVEIGGSGMVHPNVLIAGGYDPDRVSGFAFGFGIERLAQRRYNIPHIRTLYDNDMRFLRQF